MTFHLIDVPVKGYFLNSCYLTSYCLPLFLLIRCIHRNNSNPFKDNFFFRSAASEGFPLIFSLGFCLRYLHFCYQRFLSISFCDYIVTQLFSNCNTQYYIMLSVFLCLKYRIYLFYPFFLLTPSLRFAIINMLGFLCPSFLLSGSRLFPNFSPNHPLLSGAFRIGFIFFKTPYTKK